MGAPNAVRNCHHGDCCADLRGDAVSDYRARIRRFRRLSTGRGIGANRDFNRPRGIAASASRRTRRDAPDFVRCARAIGCVPVVGGPCWPEGRGRGDGHLPPAAAGHAVGRSGGDADSEGRTPAARSCGTETGIGVGGGILGPGFDVREASDKMSSLDAIQETLDEMMGILSDRGEEGWSRVFKQMQCELRENRSSGLGGIMSLFGGAGSLNDLILYKNGQPAKIENDRFSVLRDRLYDQAVEARTIGTY